GKDRIGLHGQEFTSKAPILLGIACSPTFLDLHVAADSPTQFVKPLAKCGDPTFRLRVFCNSDQHADPSDAIALLCARRERPGRRRAPEQRDELAALHSITLSARSRKLSGIVSPISFAVLRLIASVNLVGCSTGKSAGLAPLRMRSI